MSQNRDTQASLLKRLKQESDPAAARGLALDLLRASLKRERIDAALHALEKAGVDDSAHPVIRAKALYYFENSRKDAGGLLREKLIRLLIQIGHPDDADLYLMGLNTYESQLGLDVTQKLRAVSLIGLGVVDPTLARAYAVRLLGEPDTSPLSGEPSVTAISVLANFDERLPIYQFILLAGPAAIEAKKADLVGRAFESLGAAFPVDLYRRAAVPFIAQDVPVVSMGVINHIVEHRIETLYPLLEDILNRTRHDDLHRFGVIVMAASRDDQLKEMLYRLARVSPQRRVSHFIEAVELTFGEERDVLLAELKKRA